MRGFLLFLLSFLLIYCAEKRYRIKKLFLYPAIVLCPCVVVSSYACVMADRMVTKKTELTKGLKILYHILFYLLMVLIAFMAGGFQLHLELSPVSIIVLLFSAVAYWLLGTQLFPKERIGQGCFLFVCILFRLFTYPALDGTKLENATELSAGILIIKQIIVPLILYGLLKNGTDRPLLEELTMKEEPVVGKKLLNIKVLAIAFIIFVLLTACSIFTLNTKINNLSLYIQNMQENTEQSQTEQPQPDKMEAE
ncbi:MAG: hypothetical protein GX567_05475 [Clostridia bacterium]|nr:hypothetical protein [Clostridia bacterium]